MPAVRTAPRIGVTRLALAMAVGFALCARLLVALGLPPWQGPDEPRHFEYVRLLDDKLPQLLAEHRLIRMDEDSPGLQREIIDSMNQHEFWTLARRREPSPPPTTFFDIWGGSSTQLKQSISPYHFLLAAALLPFDGWPLEAELDLVRGVTAVLSGLTVLVAYGIGRELAPDDDFVPLTAAWFLAALPMHVFMGGVVNTDNLVTLLGGVVVLLLVRGLVRGFGAPSWLLTLGVLVLAVLAKRAALVLLPWWVLVAVAWPLARRSRRWLVVGGTVVAVAAVLAGAVALGLGPLASVRDALVYYFLNEPDQVSRLFDGRLVDPRTPGMVAFYLEELHRSFWGVFGWYSVQLDDGLYALLTGVTAFCAFGLVVYLVKGARRWSSDRRWLAVVLLLAILLSLIPLAVLERLSYYQEFSFPTGRYLFAIAAPMAA